MEDYLIGYKKSINVIGQISENIWNNKKNLILVTHYVVISEILNISPLSGQIIITNTKFEILEKISIK